MTKRLSIVLPTLFAAVLAASSPGKAGAPAPLLKPRVHTQIVMPTNSQYADRFLRDRDLVLQKIHVASRDQVFSQKLVRYADVDGLRNRDLQIASGRLVWEIMIHCPDQLKTPIGRFKSGAMVLNIVDAESHRLLAFRVYGTLLTIPRESHASVPAVRRHR